MADRNGAMKRLHRELDPEWFYWQRFFVSLGKVAICIVIGLIFAWIWWVVIGHDPRTRW